MDFLNFQLPWKKHPDRLGIDIGAHSLKVVRLKYLGGKGFEVVSCGLLEAPLEGATQIDHARITAFLKEISGGLSYAAVNIDDASLRIRRMSFAKMPERDLLEAIKWNFREHIECPIGEYQVSYTPITMWGEEGKIVCSAFGISKQAVRQRMDLIRRLGFKTISIEPNATALLAAFDYSVMWKPKQPVACVMFGEANTYFIVVSDGEVLFSRPIPAVSSEGFAKFMANKMRIDNEQARETIKGVITGGIKLSMTNTDEASHNDLADVIKSFYSQIIVETQKSIDAFCIMFGAEHVDLVYLCGDMAYSPHIIDHMNESLGIATQLFDPFEHAVTDRLNPAGREKSAMFAVAFGLAIP